MFKFKPLLMQSLWGGEKIIPFKHLDSDLTNVGESWEISGVKNNETVVDGGEYDGTPLNVLVERLGPKLVGQDNYERFGNEFPLLIKFIDARDDLSIQVHPTDEIALRQGRQRGKTEMWYLMSSDKGAKLYCGLKKKITPEEYAAMVENDTICDALAQYEVKEDDVFFLPAGRIHAIGAGCFIAEIQQTSNITYRIYDYDRTDAAGNKRELHTELAKDAIDYHLEDDYRTAYTPQVDAPVELVSCRYFETNLLDLDAPLTRDWSKLDSFVIYICMEGGVRLTDADGTVVELHQGQSVLVPASNPSLTLTPVGKVKLLETYIPAAK